MDESLIDSSGPNNNICPETRNRPTVIKIASITPTLAEPSTNNPLPENIDETQDGRRESPPPNCAICLGKCTNKCFTDSCLHQFCFTCLLQWSKIRPVCPLCKQNFKSIIHNVRSNNEYEEYLVADPPIVNDHLLDLHLPSLASYAAQRFRYRTTLTLHRREHMALQNYLLDHTLHNSFYSEADTRPLERRPSALAFRVSIYRLNLWAKPVPDNNGRFRGCSPSFYRRNPQLVLQLLPFINREIPLLTPTSLEHCSHVISVIISILPRFHVLSQPFFHIMSPFLHENTPHFQHELYGFARCPFDLLSYDRGVEYVSHEELLATQSNVISINSDSEEYDSDVLVVSPDHNYVGLQNEAAEQLIRAATNVNTALYVNEEPGPSSIASSPNDTEIGTPEDADLVVPIEIVSESSSDSDSDACVIVGFLKPPEQRTPEHITLNSDSDTDVELDQNDSEVPSPVIEIQKEIDHAYDSDDEEESDYERRSDRDREKNRRRRQTRYSSGELYSPVKKTVKTNKRKNTEKVAKRQPSKRKRIFSDSSAKSDNETSSQSVQSDCRHQSPLSPPSPPCQCKSKTSATRGRPIRKNSKPRPSTSKSRTNEHSKSKATTKKSANAKKGKTIQRGKKTNTPVKRQPKKAKKLLTDSADETDSDSDSFVKKVAHSNNVFNTGTSSTRAIQNNEHSNTRYGYKAPQMGATKGKALQPPKRTFVRHPLHRMRLFDRSSSDSEPEPVSTMERYDYYKPGLEDNPYYPMSEQIKYFSHS